MFPSMAFVLKAGEIREDGEILPMIQGVSLQQVEAVADWLALATVSTVVVRCITAETGVRDIKRHVSDVQLCPLKIERPSS